MRPYVDRMDAGRNLSERLFRYHRAPNTIVLGLPRGGVVVAAAVAKQLELPLDVFCVRKLGTPGYEELAMGAVSGCGAQILNLDIIEKLGIKESQIQKETEIELQELKRREGFYRCDRPPLSLAGKHVILVDDGLATGATLKAAIFAIYEAKPKKLTVAVPVGAGDSCIELEQQVDEMICPFRPEPFRAVGRWYEDFSETPDEQVKELLASPSAAPPC